MSILLKWKNKLHDPSSYETKIREFDERVTVLKSENVELHKRIDQLEALCTNGTDTQRTRFLQNHIRELEHENGRLFAENQQQRQEYERFLDQLTTMVLRTAVLQENIRKECASIYHVIERLSTLTTNAIENKHSDQSECRTKCLRSLSWDNFNRHCELISNYQLFLKSPETTAEFIRHLYRNRSSLSSSTSSSSSCSSDTTHCTFSTSGSWTLDLPSSNKNPTIQTPILPITSEPISAESQPEKKEDQQQEHLVLQRSETFIVSKIQQEELSSTTSDVKTMTTNERCLNSNVQRCPTTRSMTAPTSAANRPSRLPSRCSNSRNANTNNTSKSTSSAKNTNTNTKKTITTTTTTNNNNNSRSLSIKKASKVPVRTGTSLTKQVTSVKKSNVSTSGTTTIKKDPTATSNRAAASSNNASAKKTIHPPTSSKPTAVQNSSSKSRSRSFTTGNNNQKNNTNTPIQLSLNKHTRTIPPVVKKTTIEAVVSPKKLIKTNEEKSVCANEQMNSTSSESSIEENQHVNKLFTTVQDEGYSTWSSSDVKDDLKVNSLKKNGSEERRRNAGLVKNWLDTTSNKCNSKNPVKEVDPDKLDEFTRELSDAPSIICPFVRNRCSNGVIIPLVSTALLSQAPSKLPDKDISLDSLDGTDSPQPKDQTITSSSPSSSSSTSSSTTFSPSETFEKVLIKDSLPVMNDDLADSTDSTCSDLNQMFNIAEYIEDNFIDHDEHSNEHESSFDTSLKTSTQTKKQPQKRLMFPGLFNRLIFLRRVLSDSDLGQKVCCINENEVLFHVYHSNTINEHSVELNLTNTYGSDSELHVWSHDCAEQRRFADERQQRSIIESHQPQSKLSPIERMIRMTIDDNEDDETNFFEYDGEGYDQQLAIERQTLLQQIYEYPWLLQDDDLEQTNVFLSPNSEQPLLSPTPDLVVPSHNPDFYQLCALTNSSSFATSYGTNSRHTTPPIASSVL